jgi:Spy/CpxP family protein refolding chaperone
VAEQLGLTDEQRTKVGEIEARTASEMQSLAMGEVQDLANFGTPFEIQKVFAEKQQQAQELGSELQKLWNESGEELLDELTPEQKEKWSELTGEPFEFPEP